MKNKILNILTTVLLLCFSTEMAAQHTIKGQVRSLVGKEITAATINAFSDSTCKKLTSYAISKQKGLFELKIKQFPVWVSASSIGYKKEVLRVDSVPEMLQIVLEDETHTLSEVIVKQRYTGVKVVGDTVKFNTNFFKNGTETTVADVLKKLPGVNVGKDGSVAYEGKGVNYVLVDGKDLFSKENSGIAINNMNAALMTGAEIWKNYQSDKLSDELKNIKSVAINIKTAQKIKITGNLSAGGGIKNKADGKASLISLYDKLSGTALLSGNNLGHEVISYMDYLNYITTAVNVGNGVMMSELNETESMMQSIPDGAVKNKAGIVAVSTKHVPNKKFTLESSVLYTGKSVSDRSSSIESYLDTNNTVNKAFENNKRSRFLNIKLSETWRPNRKLEIVNISKFSLLDGDNVQKLSSDEVKDYNQSTSEAYKNFRLSNFLMATKKLGKGFLNGKVNLELVRGNNDMDLNTNEALLPRTYLPGTDDLYGYRLMTNTKDLNLKINSEIAYKLNISRMFTFNTRVGYNYLKYEYKYGEPQIEQKEYVDFNEFQSQVSLTSHIRKLDISLESAFNLHNWQTNTALGGNHKFYILPSLTLKYKFTQMHDIEFKVSKAVRRVPFSQITSLPIISRYNILSGNTEIKNPYTEAIAYDFSYHLFNPQTSLGIYAGYNRTSESPAIFSIRKDNYYISSYKAGGPSDSFHGGAYLQQQLPFAPIDFSANLSAHKFTSQMFIDDILKESKNTYFSVGGGLSSRFKRRWNFELEYGYKTNHHKVENSHIDFSSNTWSIREKILYAHKQLTGNVRLGYWKTSSQIFKNDLWDLGFDIRYKIKNIQLFISGENLLKLNGYDMTDVSFSSFYSSQTIYRKMPGHLLLGLSYQF